MLRISCPHFNIDHSIRGLITPRETPESHLSAGLEETVGGGLKVLRSVQIKVEGQSEPRKSIGSVGTVVILPSPHSDPALSRAHFPQYTLLRYSNTPKQITLSCCS